MAPTLKNLMPGRPRGFALIVAISLLAFILLLLVSLSSMVMVETQTATVNKQLEAARQNALFGLQVAIGELQQNAGPDQRITATADILPATNSAKAKYTGVWDADPDSATFEQPLAWLASQRAVVNPIIDNTTAPDATHAFELVSARRVGQPDEVPAVEAELIDVAGANGAATGQFAWWIGDEGVKARVNLANSTASPAGVTKTLAERAAPEALLTDPLLQISFEKSLIPEDAAIPGSEPVYRIDNRGAYPFWGSTVAEQELFKEEFADSIHELTPYSLGLFTNTREGGFRYDMTTLFEKDDNAFQDINVTQILARGGDRAIIEPMLITDYNPDGVDAAHLFAVLVNGTDRIPGPTWNILRDYYRQYMRVDHVGGTLTPQRALPLSQNNHSELGIRSMHGNIEGNYGQWHEETVSYEPSWGMPSGEYPVIRPTAMKVHPVVTEMQYLISYRLVINPDADTDPATPDDYELQLIIDPIITLWNPYNVDLDLSDHALTVHSRGLPVGLNIEIDPDGPGGSTAPVEYDVNLVALLGGESAETSYRVSLTDVLLPAGSVATFSPNNVSPSPQTSDLQLSEGWLQDGGFYVERLAVNDNHNPNDPDRRRVVGSLDATGTVTLDHDDSTWAKNLFSRVWLMDQALDNSVRWQFRTVGNNKPQSFEVTEIVIHQRGYKNAASAMSPIPIAFSYTDPITGATALDEAKAPFALLRFYLKAEDEFGGRLGQYSPMAYITASAIAGISGAANDTHPAAPNWGLEMPDNINSYTAVNDGFFGSSRSAGGNDNLIIYDIPRAPLHSPAQLQHADASIFAIEPMHVIGNSYASPFIPLDDTVNEFEIKFADMSYHANEALWDRFFFSTVTDGDPNTTQGGLGVPDKTALTAFLDGPLNNPLPNSRIWPLPSNQPTATIVNDVFAQDGFTKVAQYVGMRGAFNINSTDLNSWKTVLSGTRGKSSAGQSDYSRFSDPTSTEEDSGQWSGYRSLSDPEINALAQEIVNRVRVEGPFLSLADFINRDPDANDNQQRQAGLLQRAIDATTINDGFNQVAPGINVGEAIAANGTGKIASGAATYISQADILTPIGSFIAPRSDTFIVRTVGRSINPLTDEVEGSAYLEAVVQRMPTGPGATDRRFEVATLRWLDPDEI